MCNDPQNAAERSRRAVARIGRALGIPVSALYEPAAETVALSGPAGPAEIHTLVQAYLRISDPEARRRCIEFIQASAHREPESLEPRSPSSP